MATYTSNWNLLKPESIDLGGSVNDFVDVESQLNRNLDIVDNLGFRTSEYRVVNTPYNNFPQTGNRNGDKLYNQYDGAIYVWDTSGTPDTWSYTMASSPGSAWSDITLAAGFENVAGVNYNAGYKIIDNGPTGGPYRVRLRGRIRQTSYAVFTIGAAYNPTGASALPSPPTSQYFMNVCGGVIAKYFRVFIGTNGQLEVRYFSNTAMSAGDAQNFVDLGGTVYSLAT